MNSNGIMLRATIEQFYKLDEVVWQAFFGGVQYKSFKKRETILQQGAVEKHIYFVIQGCIKSSIFSEAKEHALDFAFTGEFISSYVSYLTEEASNITLQAIEKTDLFCIPKSHINDMYDRFKAAERVGRLVSEQLYIQKANREQDLLIRSARERYKKLLDRNSYYVQKLPLKYIASYLGIHPESLSRIRRQIS